MSEKDNISSRFKLKKEKKINISNEKLLKFTDDIINAVSVNEERQEIKSVTSFDIQDSYKEALLEKIELIPVWFEYSENKQQELIKSFVQNKIAKENVIISDIDKDLLLDSLFASVSGFGSVQYLLENSNVDAVTINGTESVYIEIDGKILDTETRLTEKELKFILKYVSSITGVKNFDNICNLSSNDYHITVIGSGICFSGVNICIRKCNDIGTSELLVKGVLSENILKFLKKAVAERKNIVFSGGINTCKTIVIRSLLKDIISAKRIFVVEDRPQIKVNKTGITCFCVDSNSGIYGELISYIQKSEPDYIITDLNIADSQISPLDGKIVSVRAQSVEECLRLLISSYVKSGMLEKYAKMSALNDYDYIIHLGKDANGTVKIMSIVKLLPEKTMAMSVKSILKSIEQCDKKRSKKAVSPRKIKELPTLSSGLSKSSEK